MRRSFRDYIIQRTCTKTYEDYHRYKVDLRSDFKGRCAYCNLLDTQITTPFEIDHFIPEAAFKDEWPELKKTYANLVYSCKKCNRAKSNQYKGDIHEHAIQNDLFYEPEETDYGTIFFRDDDGSIGSDDKKGRDMIVRLQLYRPIHNLAWICEITKSTLDKLSKRIEQVGKDSPRGHALREAQEELRDYYEDCQAVFIANYNNRDYKLLHQSKED